MNILLDCRLINLFVSKHMPAIYICCLLADYTTQLLIMPFYVVQTHYLQEEGFLALIR